MKDKYSNGSSRTNNNKTSDDEYEDDKNNNRNDHTVGFLPTTSDNDSTSSDSLLLIFEQDVDGDSCSVIDQSSSTSSHHLQQQHRQQHQLSLNIILDEESNNQILMRQCMAKHVEQVAQGLTFPDTATIHGTTTTFPRSSTSIPPTCSEGGLMTLLESWTEDTSTTKEGNTVIGSSISMILLLAIILLVFTTMDTSSTISSESNDNSNNNNLIGEGGITAPTAVPSSFLPSSSNYSTIVPSLIPPKHEDEPTLPINSVNFGDLVYFELNFDKKGTKNNYIDSMSSFITSSNTTMPISNLWLSGDYQADNLEHVTTRDLQHYYEQGTDTNEGTNPVDLGQFEWILRSEINRATAAATTTTTSGQSDNSPSSVNDCIRYGDSIFLQVNHPQQHRWLSGGGGQVPAQHDDEEEETTVNVSTRDIAQDEEEQNLGYHYEWIVRSTSRFVLQYGEVDPQQGRCVTYDNVLYLQLGGGGGDDDGGDDEDKQDCWLTGGRSSSFSSSPPPMEQVYCKNVNAVNELGHQDLYQWIIRRCAIACN